jgi:hypothetical protein
MAGYKVHWSFHPTDHKSSRKLRKLNAVSPKFTHLKSVRIIYSSRHAWFIGQRCIENLSTTLLDGPHKSPGWNGWLIALNWKRTFSNSKKPYMKGKGMYLQRLVIEGMNERLKCKLQSELRLFVFIQWVSEYGQPIGRGKRFLGTYHT